MVTLMYLAVVLFGVKGTSSPLNILITCGQLGVNRVMISTGLHPRLVCFTGQIFADLTYLVYGTWIYFVL